jgi:hypothetical protein
MVVLFPAQIDTSLSIPITIDGTTGVNASVINTLRSAILAIENTLGVNPAGVYATVRARLDNLENLIVMLQEGEGTTVNFAGDLFGNTVAQKVIGIQTIPVATNTPLQSYTIVFDTSIGHYNVRQLSEDDILPAFAITSFSGGSTVEIGATVVNPSFSITYSTPAISANITNTDAIDSPLTLSSPFTSGTVVGSFHHTSQNTVVFTLNASAATNKTATTNLNFFPRSFAGVGTAGGTGASASGASAILSGATGTLSSLGLFSSAVGISTPTLSPSSQKIYILTPHTSTPHAFHDNLGFSFPMNSPTNFSFTNQNSSTLSYDLYESVNVLSSSFAITIVT